MKKKLILLLVIAIVVLYGCNTQQQDIQETPDQQEPDTKPQEIQDWKDIELKDIKTNSNFKISDFKDKPVLLESFAVWCPTCTKQQKEIKKLHEEVGDSVISISLDTDPNEDESKVLDHITSNDFTWLYSISPVELTQNLIDEFGQSVVFAPQAPVILICNGNTKLLDKGVKFAEELKQEIEGC